MRNPATESDMDEATICDTSQGAEIAIKDGLTVHHREHVDGGTGDPAGDIQQGLVTRGLIRLRALAVFI